MTKKTLTKILLMISYILLVFVLSIIAYNSGQKNNLSEYIHLMAKITIIQLIINLFYIKMVKLNIFSPIGIFIIFLSIFNFGQLFLKGFMHEYVFTLLDVSMSVTDSLYIQSCNYCLIIIFLFMIGALISTVNGSHKVIKNYHNKYFMYCKPIGYILLIITVPVMLYIDINTIIVSISDGYLATFSIKTPGYLSFIADMFLPAVILLLFAYKDNIFAAKIIIITTIFYKVLSMLGGHRAFAVVFIIVLCYIYTNNIHKLSPKSVVMIVCGGFFLLTTLNVVASIRGTSAKSFELIYNTYIITFQNNIIFKSLEEYGGTLLTTCLSLTYYPNTFDYLYGAGYYKALATILPNIGGILNSIPMEINSVLKLNQLVQFLGGSFIAELYCNFGIFSYFIAIIFGFLIGKFSTAYEQSIKSNNYLFIAMYSLSFCVSLFWIRDNFAVLVRETFWCAGTIYLIYRFLKGFIRKSTVREM